MKRVRLFACMSTWLCVSSGVLAEPSAEPSPVQYSFDDDLVHGDLIRPDTEVITLRKRGARVSLIELRTSYLDALLKSVEDL